MKALAPARVREVRVHPDTGTAEVIVPDFQLSLAIGKEGQNARLAARLTGWRVDIKSEAQLAEEEAGGGVEYAEGEWVQSPTGELVWQPAEGGEAISAAAAGYAAPDAAGAVTTEAVVPAAAAITDPAETDAPVVLDEDEEAAAAAPDAPDARSGPPAGEATDDTAAPAKEAAVDAGASRDGGGD